MNNEIRLQIFSDFAPSSGLKNAFKSWAYGKTTYKNITVVDDDTYTHAAIYNVGMPNLKIDKKNVVAFQHEPYNVLDYTPFKNYAKDHIGTWFVHDKRMFMDVECAKEGLCYLAPGLPITTEDYNFYSGQKIFKMNILASDKRYLPGHILRHRIIQRILQTDMDIHILGRCSKLYNDKRVKGEVNHKAGAFTPYAFSIAIENEKYNSWVTEKFYDPILGNCVPLYWGADSISNYFNDDSFIKLPNTNLDDIMNVITDVYKNGSVYNKNTNVVKQRLYSDLNFAHFLWNHFNANNS